MIIRFFRHLAESFKSLKRNGWMTVAAVGTVMFTLTLVAIFVSIILNTAKLASDIENNVQVKVFLRVDSTDNKEVVEKDGQEIKNESYHKIYNQITANKDVASVKFSSKEEELQRLIDTLGKEWELFSGDSSPLYDVYVIQTTEPSKVKSVSETIKKIDGVEKVEYGGANTERLFALAGVVRTWGMVITAFLIFAAILLISNTIRITIISRSREIQIMRLVGAKKGYIRAPFLLEGAWIGLLGAIVPAALLYFGYDFAYAQFAKSLADQNLAMFTPDFFLPYAIGGIFLLGILIGAIGSSISMRRFLKA